MGMMDNKAFIFSGLALLLVIPTVILAASFISTLSTGTTGVVTHLTGDKVFVLFEFIEKDLDRALAITGRRAAVSGLDYQKIWNETLESTYNSATYGSGACGAIKEMIFTGALADAPNPYDPTLMINNSLIDWIANMNYTADQIGYNLTLDTPPVTSLECDCINQSHFNLEVSLTGVAADESGNFKYNGSFPRSGKSTASVSAAGTNTDLFPNCQNLLPQVIISSPNNNDIYDWDDTITFNGSLSYDPDNDLPLTYSWLKDGSYIGGFSFMTHFGRFLNDGFWTITLQVTDAKGGANSTSINITVNPGTSATLGPLTPINDTYIDENDDSGNFGSLDEIHIKRQNNQAKRALLYFNLTSIPAGSTISSAVLTIYAKGANTTGDIVDAHRITSSWGELTATWANANSSYDSGVIIDSNQTVLSSMSFELKTSVQDFVDGTDQNYGWLIKIRGDNTGNDQMIFYSREDIGWPSPEIFITYIPP
jgi:hypothetical protein